MELPDPPEGWNLKSLIEIDLNSWSALYWAPEAYVYGTGTTARYAMLDANRRIEDGNFFEHLGGVKKFDGVKLDLSFIPPKALDDRRF